ncbi:hypothetical protein COY13_00415 [Candidatus Roizmanbacteria bacterium CG_4_10_14_0_2_um_filter_36_35]|uniref:DUF11 domain-containing protein n=5 Tax=Candidatus Roizmaniibacteriota TaxID=1752723 RepID=A0A2M7BWG7_9BACT|nr:MAG: hypothetical protein COV86_02525 [Candidatus Roizmanbacteria bacterium CG11_big_fil_rev_8_21_14_0_20_35_14]PIV10924.1 MAG: hypothetical protein COS50_02940 [Candidatus Roizmanbacteria bacterium CG03_land_8_20_14_0_80_35_26]PIZ68815.1 MAG: hypothetical protein COY13_00415 [Candidatus Roizmanbacteria bacterium CG_4_10_14_0_2_um_filter_36_35]PJC32303.1 MAG: hypothetical protein CO049_03315 [Candidatus Roizmanbacteria bacterium CG_4_9_14_0_2_um_filter_36_12]PJC79854.1 MAG: hypothetical prot
MKKLISLVAVLGALIFLVSSVLASDCGGLYQPSCQSYSISINKMVGMPGNSTDAASYQYVDNLTVSDPRFSPEQLVFFKVIVKNTSTTTLGGMTVKDNVPSYLTPVEGPGTFDATNRTIAWDAGFFNVNEEKTYYFKMQVNQQSSLPSDKGLFCVVNKAEASSNTTSNSDSSQLCIEKKVTAAAVPSAGPELGMLLISGEIALIGAGLYLRKKS